eukprot:414227-Rhodomonas_salina.1
MAGGWSQWWHNAIVVDRQNAGRAEGGIRARGGKLPGSIADRFRPAREGGRRPSMKETAFWHAAACVSSGVSHIASLEYVRWKYGTERTDIWSMLALFFNGKPDTQASDEDGDADNEDGGER